MVGEKKEFTDKSGLKLIADHSMDEMNEADILLISCGFSIVNDKIFVNLSSGFVILCGIDK